MDRLFIENLKVYGNHGVLPEETKLGQMFIISVDMFTDISQACRTDELTAAVDYGEVAQFIIEFVESRTFLLLETLADRLANGILVAFPRLEQVTLKIDKPQAPIRLHFDNVGIEVTRQRQA
ncbi:MAG: dihydroneopterin aldolase [Syntrophomonadaceae bacterium]|nr:dihydroneopterin aldolase [Syntrophomonadaceae bacterium]